MIKYTNDCNDCDDCAGCGLKHNAHFICDKCKAEDDVLYDTPDGQLCKDCLIGLYPIVEEEN